MAWRPSSSRSALAVGGAAALDVILGARIAPTFGVLAPLIAFLCAALTLAALAERSGLAQRVAAVLSARARGNALALYVLVCALCALLTAMVSLDGAVVLMLPLLLTLKRRFQAPFAPLFLGVVVVANAASIAVPQGNPTNLVVINRLGISPGNFLEHMLLPGLGAAMLCATIVAVSERRELRAATPQGSVATLIATGLAGVDAPRLPLRYFGPLAAAAVLAATLLLWAST